jgi:hypothetical protein
MNVYIEPLIDDFLKLWVGITMYDISRPIGKKIFKFHGILSWTIHDASGLTNFCGILLLYFVIQYYIYLLKISCIILTCNFNLTLH